MFDTVFGLPVHPLVVHATVVVVPAAALAVGLAALWPRFRAWAGPLPLLLSIAALVLVPASVQSGQSLKGRIAETALVQRHSELGEGLLVWAVVLAVGAAALFWLRSRELHDTAAGRAAPSRLTVAALVLVALVGVGGATFQIVLIGHSGAEAAWTNVVRDARRG
jgi:hypothetical protein